MITLSVITLSGFHCTFFQIPGGIPFPATGVPVDLVGKVCGRVFNSVSVPVVGPPLSICSKKKSYFFISAILHQVLK